MFNQRRTIGKKRILRPPPKHGALLSIYETEGAFSLAVGDSQTLIENFMVSNHSNLHFHAWLDAEVTVTVEWRAGEGFDWITAPSPIVIPASVSDVGTVHEVSIHSPYYRVTILNSDIIPLTFLKISVYGNK